ncbi:LysE family translocator [Luteolibacter sp. Populi]|uniref:LysE family translocator n=1 Tax=Luteolibacter sp. Populi TaxID=3230487 RepID=UPI003465E91C
MFGIHDFGVFLAACIVLNLTPGPDTFYILGRSMAQGRAAGLASVFGIACGTVVHTLAAALGISAILAASASAFLVIKLAGAAYLIYLGIRMILTRSSPAAIPADFSSSGFLAIFRQGLITNVLNPKVALFFLAFVPQFISADSTSKFAAFVTLGLSFVGTGTVWCLILVRGSSWLGDRLRHSRSFSNWLNRGAGALFVFLGIRLATTKS